MLRRCLPFALSVLILAGCQKNDGVNVVGKPDTGMTQQELIDAAHKKTPTNVVGFLEVGQGGKDKIPLRWVGMWTDPETKTEEEFAISLGRTMRAMSASTETEFCAQICKQGRTWGAAILTIDSGRFCPSTHICPSEHWKASGHPIHSHRRSGEYVSTPQDELLRTGTLAPAREIDLAAERASKEDSKHAGWVVMQHGLLFVAPDGDIRDVWDYVRETPGRPAQTSTPKPDATPPKIITTSMTPPVAQSPKITGPAPALRATPPPGQVVAKPAQPTED